MDKIYNDFDDTNVAVRKVYVKTDGFAYVDSACKTKITADALYNIFIKGMIIVDASGVEYVPISCKVASGVTTITYATTDSSAATTAKLATAKSK